MEPRTIPAADYELTDWDHEIWEACGEGLEMLVKMIERPSTYQELEEEYGRLLRDLLEEEGACPEDFWFEFYV